MKVKLRMDNARLNEVPFLDANHPLHQYYAFLKSSGSLLPAEMLPPDWPFERQAPAPRLASPTPEVEPEEPFRPRMRSAAIFGFESKSTKWL